jgi:hypothetical protein
MSSKAAKSSVSEVISGLRAPRFDRGERWASVAKLEVVEASPPYIRTVKDGSISDNLLTITSY